MRVLCVVGVSLVALATPVLANKADYCAAYARDFADARSKDKPIWQHKYDIALAACNAEPQKAEVTKPAPVVKKPVIKVKAPPAIVPPIPPEPVVVEAPKIKPTKAEKLEAGSPAWNDYCSKKYTSFNVKTGTYTSKTGIERKCLVN
jgi:BA14K-like protein